MSALLIAEFLPLVVVGFLVGPLVDRWSRRRILVATDLARAAVFVLLPFAPNALSIVGLALVAGIATSFFRPAALRRAPEPRFPERLPRANALLQSADNLTGRSARSWAGRVVAVASPDAAYAINALSFVVSAVLLLRIRSSLEEADGSRAAATSASSPTGSRSCCASGRCSPCSCAWSLVMLANAGVNVGEIFLAKDVFDAGDFGFGYLVAPGPSGSSSAASARAP